MMFSLIHLLWSIWLPAGESPAIFFYAGMAPMAHTDSSFGAARQFAAARFLIS